MRAGDVTKKICHLLINFVPFCSIVTAFCYLWWLPCRFISLENRIFINSGFFGWTRILFLCIGKVMSIRFLFCNKMWCLWVYISVYIHRNINTSRMKFTKIIKMPNQNTAWFIKNSTVSSLQPLSSWSFSGWLKDHFRSNIRI